MAPAPAGSDTATAVEGAKVSVYKPRFFPLIIEGTAAPSSIRVMPCRTRGADPATSTASATVSSQASVYADRRVETSPASLADVKLAVDDVPNAVVLLAEPTLHEHQPVLLATSDRDVA